DGTESAPTNLAAAGVGEGTIQSVTLTPKKLVAAGAGFTTKVRVLVDGIRFKAAARVRNRTKVIQAGALEDGQTGAAYLAAPGGTALLTIENANGAPATFRLTR